MRTDILLPPNASLTERTRWLRIRIERALNPSRKNPRRIPVLEIHFSVEDECLRGLAWRKCRKGYCRTTFNNKPFAPVTILAHHIVMLRAFGRIPDYSKGETCDHINMDKSDNRRENLRFLPLRENSIPRKPDDSKPGDPKYARRCGRGWRSEIRINGNRHDLGVFRSPEASKAAALEARRVSSMNPLNLHPLPQL